MADARACLRNMNATLTRAYVTAVYGSVPRLNPRWWWPRVDVIWLDLLDATVRACIDAASGTEAFSGLQGKWAVHTARGFYLPPIGSKQLWPVIWQYRDELGCAGQASEAGGPSPRPQPVESAGTWIEVFHYYRRLPDLMEQDELWFYKATGSGVWYHTGRTMAFADTADLSLWMRTQSNGSIPSTKPYLLRAATKLLRSRGFDTLLFTHHVDKGFDHQQACTKPRPGWDAVYTTFYEVVSLSRHGAGRYTCPPRPFLRGGWNASAACECDPYALRHGWPSLKKDRDWQLGTVRCAPPPPQPQHVAPRPASPSPSALRLNWSEPLWRRIHAAWQGSEGLAFRTHECTRQWKNNATKQELKVCAALESSSAAQSSLPDGVVPACYLRHDLPVDVFKYERDRQHFAVGWILNASSMYRSHPLIGFPHDPWSGQPGNRPRCRGLPDPRVYAEDFRRVSRSCADYKTWFNERGNVTQCHVQNLTHIMLMQRERARLTPSCAYNYNQVQVSYRSADILGVFYTSHSSYRYAMQLASEYGKSHAPLPLVLVVGGPRLCPGGWPRGEAGECNYKGLSLESYLAAFPDARRLPPQEDAPA